MQLLFLERTTSVRVQSLEIFSIMKAEMLLHIPGTQLGEGPVWMADTGRLHWVDIERGLLHSTHLETLQTETREIGQMVGAAVPCDDGRWLLAMANGLAFYDWTSRQLELVSDPEADLPDNRFNDGKCDPQGRLWAGTMRREEPRPAVAAFYRMDTSRRVQKMLDGVKLSNGLAWNAAGDKLFYNDTGQNSTFVFDFDAETGTISNQQTLHVEKNWNPDGMCIDLEDRLWIACYGAGEIQCFDSTTGNKLAVIATPAPCPTSCCFGGPNLDQLYITSAQDGEDSDGGGLFIAQPETQGRPVTLFKTR